MPTTCQAVQTFLASGEGKGGGGGAGEQADKSGAASGGREGVWAGRGWEGGGGWRGRPGVAASKLIGLLQLTGMNVCSRVLVKP